ncbi:MAG: DegV family protein [Lachnospiraceae bacterium]
MRDYFITTDSTTDLPDSYYQENQLELMYLSYTVDGITYEGEHQLDVHEFYDKMRAGSLPTTAQVNPETAKDTFQKIIRNTDADILHIAFSSGLSGSYNSVRIAAEELMEKDPEHRIIVIDSLCASLGEGLLLHKAIQLKKNGATLDETANWVEENKLHLVHNFTVDDLYNLYRGGRVSKTAAILGTMVNIKPILHVDNEGHLVPVSKVRGRKKSLLTLIDSMERQMGSYRSQNDIVFISHGDCKEEAEFVASQVKERFGIDQFIIHSVGPTIGTHSGPGTMALFYLGEYR